MVSATACSSSVPSLRMWDAYTPPAFPAIAREIEDLAASGVNARHIFQPGREADGAVSHRAPHERPHSCELGDGRIAICGSHHRTPHRVVADQGRVIHGCAGFADDRQRISDVEGGGAAIPGDDGRHTHPQEVLSLRCLGHVVGMGVDVDEAWSDDEIRGINRFGRNAAGQCPDRHDTAVPYADVGAAAGRTRSVDDDATNDEEIVSCGLDAADGSERARDEAECSRAGHGADRSTTVCKPADQGGWCAARDLRRPRHRDRRRHVARGTRSQHAGGSDDEISVGVDITAVDIDHTWTLHNRLTLSKGDLDAVFPGFTLKVKPPTLLVSTR